MAAEYTYVGAEERIYSAYLTARDGEASTLIGTPGMAPAVVMRAAGNDNLPDVPGDGLWVATDQPTTNEPALSDTPSQGKAAKTGKAVNS